MLLSPPEVIEMGGYRMAVNYTDNASYKYLVDRGSYEHAEVDLLLKLVKLNDVPLILDVGANYGIYSLATAAALSANRGHGKILAVEPDERASAALNRSIKINGFEGLIILRRCVASDEEGTVTFFENSRSSADNRSHAIGSAAVRIRSSYELPARTLDSLVSEISPAHKGKFVAVMDIQGNEPRALQGLRNTLAHSEGYALFFEHSPALIRSAGLNHECSLETLNELRPERMFEFRGNRLIEHSDMSSVHERARTIDKEGDPTAQGASTDFLFVRGMILPNEMEQQARAPS
jgi:FkbM family methyltransferase